MKIIYTSALCLLFVFPVTVSATSGACSYHGGVNCNAGANSDGKVVCNDGWVNSSVYFSDAEECQNIQKCPRYYPDGQYQELKTKVEVQIQSTRDDWQKTCDEGFQRMENNNIKSYEICTRYNQGRTTSYISAGGMGQPSGLTRMRDNCVFAMQTRRFTNTKIFYLVCAQNPNNLLSLKHTARVRCRAQFMNGGAINASVWKEMNIHSLELAAQDARRYLASACQA